MTTKQLFTFLVLLTITNLCAQDTLSKKIRLITFNVLSPTLNYAPRYDLGYYQSINNRIIVGLEVGYGNYDSASNFAKDNDAVDKDFEIFEVRPEVFYIINPARRTEKFFSAEIYYIHHTDTYSTITHSYEENGKRYRFDSADYKRQKFGLNLNYGMIINFTKNLGITPKIGMGIRFRNVEHSNFVNRTQFPENNNDDDVAWLDSMDNYQHKSGNHVGFNFAFDLKVFFQF